MTVEVDITGLRRTVQVSPAAILKALSDEQRIALGRPAVSYSDDEQRVADLLLGVFGGIVALNGRKLHANHGELAAAVHVLRGFVTQSALARHGLVDAADWWED